MEEQAFYKNIHPLLRRRSPSDYVPSQYTIIKLFESKGRISFLFSVLSFSVGDDLLRTWSTTFALRSSMGLRISQGCFSQFEEQVKSNIVKLKDILPSRTFNIFKRFEWLSKTSVSRVRQSNVPVDEWISPQVKKCSGNFKTVKTACIIQYTFLQNILTE